MGRLYAERKLDDLSASSLAKTARDAKSPNLWWSIEDTLDRTGRVNDVTTIARQAKDALAQDQTRDALRASAYASLLLGDNEQAVKQFAELTADAPGDHPARRLLARAKSELGQYEEAGKLLEALVVEDPRNVDAWFDLGKYSILAGDSKRAVDDYLSRAQVLANRLDDRRMQANVIHALGIGYQNLGQLSEAADQFNQAIQRRKALNDARGVAVSLRNLSHSAGCARRFHGRTERVERCAQNPRAARRQRGARRSRQRRRRIEGRSAAIIAARSSPIATRLPRTRRSATRARSAAACSMSDSRITRSANSTMHRCTGTRPHRRTRKLTIPSGSCTRRKALASPKPRAAISCWRGNR
jgi:tetratricopeptide (TPR) repeat protein